MPSWPPSPSASSSWRRPAAAAWLSADATAGAVAGAVAGHSLGEYTALVSTGALAPDDGARLVTARGDAMQAAADARPGTMAAVLGLDPDRWPKRAAGVEGAWPANDNAPGQVVIAGTVAGRREGRRGRQGPRRQTGHAVTVGGAFHSPLMAPAQATIWTRPSGERPFTLCRT